VICINLSQFGKDLKDGDLAQKEHFSLLEQQLWQVPQHSDAILDLDGVEFIGYGYAKHAIRPCVERWLKGKYPLRSLILACRRDDYRVFLEAVELALAEVRLTVLLHLGHRDWLVPLGYLPYESPFETQKERRKKEKLLRILELLIRKTELYTNEIAHDLGLTLPNCNYLLSELESLRLVERIKESSPSGGPLFRNRLVARQAA
jgi:hypothetical protein